MRRQCEGYCGGMVDVSEMTQVAPEGDRMCGDCACKARNSYTDSDPSENTE